MSAAYLEEAIDDGDGHVHSLLQQPELDLNLNEPIDKDGTHVSRDLPPLQVSGPHCLFSLKREGRLKSAFLKMHIKLGGNSVRNKLRGLIPPPIKTHLQLPQVLVDILHILAAQHGVVIVVSINILNVLDERI